VRHEGDAYGKKAYGDVHWPLERTLGEDQRDLVKVV